MEELRSQYKVGRIGNGRQREEDVPGKGVHYRPRHGKKCLYCIGCVSLQ